MTTVSIENYWAIRAARGDRCHRDRSDSQRASLRDRGLHSDWRRDVLRWVEVEGFLTSGLFFLSDSHKSQNHVPIPEYAAFYLEGFRVYVVDTVGGAGLRPDPLVVVRVAVWKYQNDLAHSTPKCHNCNPTPTRRLPSNCK